MKILLSIGAALMLTVSAFATGNEGVNPQQAGVITYSSTTGLVQTNAFAFPYVSVPLVIGYNVAGATNTISSITTSNFVMTITTGATTNAAIPWTAYVGGTKLAFGTATNGVGNTVVTLPFAYASAPAVFIQGNNTNGIVVVSAVTTTNFTINATTAQTNSWQSIGTVYNPQTEYTGTFPVNNKVLTP